MAWLESHQDLAHHPKTKRVARKLKISVPTVIGHMHLFWWWAMDFAQDGVLTPFDPADIADAIQWHEDPILLIDALLDSRFIDLQDGKMVIHDWNDYAGKLMEIRKQDAERKRNSRKNKDTIKKSEENPSPSVGRPSDGARNSNSNNNSTLTSNSTLPSSLNSKPIITDNALPHEVDISGSNEKGGQQEQSNNVDPLIALQDAYCDLHGKLPFHLRQSELKIMKDLIAQNIPPIFIVDTMHKVYDEKKDREDDSKGGIGFRPPSSFKYYDQSIKDSWAIHLSIQQGVVIDSPGLQAKPRVSSNSGYPRRNNQQREKPQIVQSKGSSDPVSEEELERMRLLAAKLDEKLNKPNPLLIADIG